MRAFIRWILYEAGYSKRMPVEQSSPATIKIWRSRHRSDRL